MPSWRRTLLSVAKRAKCVVCWLPKICAHAWPFTKKETSKKCFEIRRGKYGHSYSKKVPSRGLRWFWTVFTQGNHGGVWRKFKCLNFTNKVRRHVMCSLHWALPTIGATKILWLDVYICTCCNEANQVLAEGIRWRPFSKNPKRPNVAVYACPHSI